MNLIKTSLLSLASTAAKMLTGLAISKALAIYVGDLTPIFWTPLN
jgi:hypothetical protein